jgi:hypothetical protein
MTDFFSSLFYKSPVGKEEPEILHKLYELPKKDKGFNRPFFDVPTAGYIHQADLLTLPEDDGYK